MSSIQEKLTYILEEFAGKVKYYELPKDLAAWSYNESDIERARKKIMELYTEAKEEGRREALGEVREKVDSLRKFADDTEGFRAFSEVVISLKQLENKK